MTAHQSHTLMNLEEVAEMLAGTCTYCEAGSLIVATTTFIDDHTDEVRIVEHAIAPTGLIHSL